MRTTNISINTDSTSYLSVCFHANLWTCAKQDSKLRSISPISTHKSPNTSLTTELSPGCILLHTPIMSAISHAHGSVSSSTILYLKTPCCISHTKWISSLVGFGLSQTSRFPCCISHRRSGAFPVHEKPANYFTDSSEHMYSLTPSDYTQLFFVGMKLKFPVLHVVPPNSGARFDCMKSLMMQWE